MSAVLEQPILRSPIASARLAWVDIAKGIGIVLVVFGHVWRGLHAAHFAMDPEFYSWVDRLVYSFHMPLFFVLSGLFIPKSLHKPAGVFLQDKLKTIAYPYVLWTLIQASVNVALASFATNPVSLGQILLEMPWRPYAHFWFLYVLFCHSLAYLALDRLRFSRVTILVLAFGLRELTYRFNLQGLEIFVNIMTNFFYFSAGAALSEFLLNRSSLWPVSRPSHAIGPQVSVVAGLPTEPRDSTAGLPQRSWADVKLAMVTLTAASLLLVAITIRFDQRLHDKLPLTLLGIVAVLAGSIWLAHHSARADLSALNIGGMLAMIGRSSLAIYLAHILATSGMRIVLQKLLHVDDLAAHVILGTLAGVLGPIALEWAAQRIGMKRLFVWR